MCDINKIKTVPRNIYRNTLVEFEHAEGILSPIHADIVLDNIFHVKHGDYTSGIVNNVINLMDGTSSVSNRVIGYFAARKQDAADCHDKFILAMSFCVPEDYHTFNAQYARFLAMRKCLANKCMMVHLNKPQRVITSGAWPFYCFDSDNTIDIQFMEFETRCISYYK